MFVDGADALPEATAAALASHLVTCKLKKAPLAKAVGILTRDSGVRMVVDPAATRHCARARFTEAFEKRPLDHALALLVVPEGLALRVEAETLRVTVR